MDVKIQEAIMKTKFGDDILSNIIRKAKKEVKWVVYTRINWCSFNEHYLDPDLPAPRPVALPVGHRVGNEVNVIRYLDDNSDNFLVLHWYPSVRTVFVRFNTAIEKKFISSLLEGFKNNIISISTGLKLFPALNNISECFKLDSDIVEAFSAQPFLNSDSIIDDKKANMQSPP